MIQLKERGQGQGEPHGLDNLSGHEPLIVTPFGFQPVAMRAEISTSWRLSVPTTSNPSYTTYDYFFFILANVTSVTISPSRSIKKL